MGTTNGTTFDTTFGTTFNMAVYWICFLANFGLTSHKFCKYSDNSASFFDNKNCGTTWCAIAVLLYIVIAVFYLH